MSTSDQTFAYCTSCGSQISESWKFCRKCGDRAATLPPAPIYKSTTVPTPKTAPTSTSKSTSSSGKIDRSIAFQCSLRWAIVSGLAVWLILGLFIPIKATVQSRIGTNFSTSKIVTKEVNCSNVFGMATNSSEWRAVTVTESDECAKVARFTFFLDGGISALIWGAVVLVILYLINRNRIVKSKSLWLPYMNESIF